MTAHHEPTAAALAPRRFELTVWPQAPGQAWRAEVSTDPCCEPGGQPGADPVAPREPQRQRFDFPLELILFLTQLPGSTPGRSGLR